MYFDPERAMVPVRPVPNIVVIQRLYRVTMPLRLGVRKCTESFVWQRALQARASALFCVNYFEE